MVLIGVTGNMGCGKTTVAKLLEAHGALRLDADQAARQAVALGSVGLAAIVNHFGPVALLADGSLHRTWLGERVALHPEDRQWLEGLIHPLVWRSFALQLQQWMPEHPRGMVVLDVPLLFETGGEHRCDITLAVTCGEQQEARLRQRNGMTEATRHAMMTRQWPEAAKVRLAHLLLDNRDDPTKLPTKVAHLWAQIHRLAEQMPESAWPGRWLDLFDEYHCIDQIPLGNSRHGQP